MGWVGGGGRLHKVNRVQRYCTVGSGFTSCMGTWHTVLRFLPSLCVSYMYTVFKLYAARFRLKYYDRTDVSSTADCVKVPSQIAKLRALRPITRQENESFAIIFKIY